MIHAEELARVFAFLAVVGVVYAAAAVVLLRRFVFKPRTLPGKRSWAVLLVAAFGIACMGYGRLVEPYWLEVTETRVPTRRLPVHHRGVRVVHLSDVHSDPTARLEERLPRLIAGLRPDLIVFTGDAANSPEGMPVFRRFASAMAKIAPTFMVKGNWDAWYFPKVDRFGGTGVTELDGTLGVVAVDGVNVHVAGLAFDSAPSLLGSALANVPADDPAIVLYHAPYPDVIPSAFRRGVDLICAGHVHGGQVALPFYGALITFSKYGKKYERGLYRTDQGPWMYVSRGIGMEGKWAPRIRFASRPEVALLELVPAD